MVPEHEAITFMLPPLAAGALNDEQAGAVLDKGTDGIPASHCPSWKVADGLSVPVWR